MKQKEMMLDTKYPQVISYRTLSACDATSCKGSKGQETPTMKKQARVFTPVQHLELIAFCEQEALSSGSDTGRHWERTSLSATGEWEGLEVGVVLDKWI